MQQGGSGSGPFLGVVAIVVGIFALWLLATGRLLAVLNAINTGTAGAVSTTTTTAATGAAGTPTPIIDNFNATPAAAVINAGSALINSSTAGGTAVQAGS